MMPSEPVTHPNPCPNPGIPPLRLEIEDIPISQSHPQYSHALAAVTAYWRQATNMALSDQQEYLELIASSAYVVSKSAEGTPSQHKLYKAIKAHSTWARYVMFHSVYGNVRSLAEHVKQAHGSDTIRNFFDQYCKHHPWPPNLTKRRRESTTDNQPPAKKHAEIPASSVSVAGLSVQLPINNKTPASKAPTQNQPAKTAQQPVEMSQASKSDNNNLTAVQRGNTPAVAQSVNPSLQEGVEAGIMDKILAELHHLRQHRIKEADKMDRIEAELRCIRQHQIKEADRMEQNVARLEGSIAEFISRFRVVEENVKSLVRQDQ